MTEESGASATIVMVSPEERYMPKSMRFSSCSAGTQVNYQVFFGLTDIPYSNFVLLTGSNGHEGVG